MAAQLEVMDAETKLELCERHVREAEAHVARQKELVEALRQNGLSISEADALLSTFEATLACHRHSLEHVRHELIAGGAL